MTSSPRQLDIDSQESDEATTPTTDNPVNARLNQQLDAIRERMQNRRKAEAAEQGVEIAKAEPEPKGKGNTSIRTRGRARPSVIEEAQLMLFNLEREGRFSAYELQPQTEFPTFLTRIPIFVPARRSTQKLLLDQDNSLPFSTPWGKGKKHGPPVGVYDEDTLIAFGRLRQNLLIGNPRHMPVPLSRIYKDLSNDVHVHVLYCMVSDIQNILGQATGGRNNRLRLESVKRLAAQVIEFDNKTAEKFVGSGTSMKLLDIAWQEYEDNAILYIQFTPMMTAWFENEYTYIDWNLRRKLSDTGKAIHRFLAGQPKDYAIYVKKLMTTIGYPRAYKRFTEDLRIALKKLQDEEWIKSWKIEGNGRRLPHKLTLQRK